MFYREYVSARIIRGNTDESCMSDGVTLSEDPLENRICNGCYGDLKENLKHATFYLLLMLHSAAFISEDKSN